MLNFIFRLQQLEQSNVWLYHRAIHFCNDWTDTAFCWIFAHQSRFSLPSSGMFLHRSFPFVLYSFPP